MSEIYHIEPSRVIHELIFKPIGTYLYRYPTENDDIISQINSQGQTKSNPYIILSVRVDEIHYHHPIMNYYLLLNQRDLPNESLPKLIEQCQITTEQTDWNIDLSRFQTNYIPLFQSEDYDIKTTIKCDNNQTISIYRKSIENNTNELSILKTLSYVHIVTFYGISFDMNSFIFADHGQSLNNYYRRIKFLNNQINERFLIMIAYQLACGMMYLEANGIIHRNLHGKNILIDQFYLIRISNFEYAIRINNDNQQNEDIQPNFQLRYLAPECLSLLTNDKSFEINQFSSNSDVWAYGLIFMELTIEINEHLYPDLPILNDDYEEIKQFIQYIKLARQIHSKPNHCPINIYEIIKQCWKYDSNQRISFTNLRNNTLNILQSIQK